jgi:OmpA-OmpF porin, OOP family
MRKLGLTLLAASMAILPYAALSQEEAQGPASADDFVCALSGECGEETAEGEAATETSGSPRVSATRGFSLSRPTPATSQPATKAGQPRSTARQTASRPASRPASQPASTTQQRRVDLRLSFGTGSAVLSAGAEVQLRAFAEALRRPQLANARVRIEGHTDSSGGRAVNMPLSQKRAQAAADFLVGQGIAAGRLEVRGYGYDRPLPGRSPSAGENRRVEAVRIS